MKISYIFLITLTLLYDGSAFCAFPSFSVRLGNQDDHEACKKLSAEVEEKVFKPIWQFNCEECYKNYCKSLEKSAFAPWSPFAQECGVLFIAEDDKKNTIGYLQAFRFYQLDRTSEIFGEFITNISQLELNQDFKWWKEKCNESTIFISRIYIDQMWKTKGIAKNLIALCLDHFKSAEKIYFDVYSRDCGELGIYLANILGQVTNIFSGKPYESIIFSVDVAKIKVPK